MMVSAPQSVPGSGLRMGCRFDNTVLVISQANLRDSSFVEVD